MTDSNQSHSPLLAVKNLNKSFTSSQGLLKPKSVLHAVNNVSFSIQKGETFGLVGESGCGKSTLGRTILRLYEPESGEILLAGDNIANLNEQALKPYRKKMQSVFQDPYSSLNPSMNVEQLISESMHIHGVLSGAANYQARKEHIIELLQKVGLKAEHLERYPHEFSGGQRQRISIARALAVNPEFILCDEPISALDVSVQAQVVNMLQDLQDELGITYLFIAHDLSMVKHISHNIGVMYLGQMVESAPSDTLYHEPAHPYTQMLLASIPVADPTLPRSDDVIAQIKLDDAKPANQSNQGCGFAHRCPQAKPICFNESPVQKQLSANHAVSCHLYL